MAGGRPSGLHRFLTPLTALVLVTAGCLAYSSSFRGVFVFDDIRSIASNPHIRSLWPLTTATSAPRDTGMAGRPVAALSFALNYALAPADVRDALTTPGPGSAPEDAGRFLRNIRGYHAVNLAVHLAAGLFLFGVVRRSLTAPGLRPRFGRSAALLAFLASLVWLAHPLNTGSVTYIVQRLESMMGLFYLATLYCAIRAAEPGPRRRWWVAGTVAACALGMGTKEVMATAPLTVVLWDLLIGAERTASGAPVPILTVLRRRWPLYAGLAATWVILAVLVAGNPRPGSVGFGLGGWTWRSYLVTQAGVVVHYLRLAIMPAPLVFDYAWPKAASLAQVAPQALLLVALLALTAVAVIRRHPAGFAGAWFFLVLAPTSSILPIPTEVAAEHRMYLPLAGIAAAAIASLHALARWTGGRRASARNDASRKPGFPVDDAAALLVGVGIAVLFGTMTHARNQVYWSDEALMRDTVTKRPLNIRARVAYGADLLAAGRFAEAEVQLDAATRLEGSDKARAQANMHLGSAMCAQGKLAEGIEHLRLALAIDPTLAEAHALLGEAYSGLGRAELAGSHFLLAADGLPENAAVLRRVAWQLATAQDPRFRDGRRAAELAGRAVRLTGRRDVLALEALMAAYAELDRFGEAAAAGREALTLARQQGNELFARGLEREVAVCEGGSKIREGSR